MGHIELTNLRPSILTSHALSRSINPQCLFPEYGDSILSDLSSGVDDFVCPLPGQEIVIPEVESLDDASIVSNLSWWIVRVMA